MCTCGGAPTTATLLCTVEETEELSLLTWRTTLTVYTLPIVRVKGGMLNIFAAIHALFRGTGTSVEAHG